MYYQIGIDEDDDGNIIGLTYEEDHPGRSWVSGDPFLSRPDLPIFRQPPPLPIQVQIKEGRENDPMPHYIHEPIPIMSHNLYNTIRLVGVDNLDVYKVEIRYQDGSLASDQYYAFNLIGKIAAADLANSTYDSDQPDNMIAMSFDSLKVDPEKTRETLMFRLAENITVVLVHEKIKLAVEEANIPYVCFHETSDIAIL